MRRISVASLLALGALIGANAAPAGAAVKVGETFTPTGGWGGTGVMIQVGSPGDIYEVPTAGVLTSWNFEATALEPTPPLKMKVVRHAGGDDFTTVADSQLQTPVQGALNTWPTRIPVNAGDLLALFFSNDTYGYDTPPDLQYVTQEISASTGTPGFDPPPGTTVTYESPKTGQRVDVSAMLEPDADRDGFGDETQDQCPTDASTQGACPAPRGAAPTCKGKKATIVGTPGNDVRKGTPGNDVIAGLGGNDKLSGLAGNDLICGGKGADLLKGGSGNDFLSGQKGNDKLLGQEGNDKLSGKAGKDTLKGGPGKDKLKGGGGKDKQVQ